jgi:hypothetical protein
MLSHLDHLLNHLGHLLNFCSSFKTLWMIFHLHMSFLILKRPFITCSTMLSLVIKSIITCNMPGSNYIINVASTPTGLLLKFLFLFLSFLSFCETGDWT